MIPKDCKRLAEVDFPIAQVSRNAAREKSIRHGHPSTLHLWWARRPLASSRAVLLASLLPDTCDELCPADFKAQARAALRPLPSVGNIGDDDMALRKALLKFIGDFSAWELSSDKRYLEAARTLVHAAHPEETPLVVDPFAGGGSIPLEALRLGCDAFASDLNPVACLILNVMLEDIPRHGRGLADELRRTGAKIRAAAEEELAGFYPLDPDGARPIAYLWARTVRCDNCGAEIPLMRSLWLSKKANRKRALRVKTKSKSGRTKAPTVEFEIFEPKNDREVRSGTVARAKATCPCCQIVLFPERIRAQLREQRGGADVTFDRDGKRAGGARLLAVVTVADDATGRMYRLPTERDYEAVWRAQRQLSTVEKTLLPNGLTASPSERLPPQGTLGFRVQLYGMESWGDLFTARQKLGLVTLTSLIRSRREPGDIQAIYTLLAMVCSKLADRCNSLVNWSVGVECPNQLFKGTAVPMGWDFAESNLISESSASIYQSIDNIAGNVEAGYVPGAHASMPTVSDACEHPLPDEAASLWFTDPPYYDAVPYADLSDFFYVWLRRALPNHTLLRDPFDPLNPLTPKSREAVQDETKLVGTVPKDRAFFEMTMAKAFAEGRRVLREDGIGSVVFAHKTTEGWEALLSGLIRGGWVVTGSWPIMTERQSRLRARDSAALATSVHLVCRPRTISEVGDWSDVVRELPPRVADWMERLQSEGVRGADLVFACIGPALEIYSRYSKVVDAEDHEVPLGGNPEATEPYRRGYLAYVWEVVGRAALEQVLGTAEARARNGAAGALEEDARLSALFLWTLQSTSPTEEIEPQPEETVPEEGEGDEDEEAPKKKMKGFSLVYDVARRFSQPLGIHLEDWEGRIIDTEKGIITLLSVTERAKQLFGEEGADAVAAGLEEDPRRAMQLELGLFPEERGTAPDLRIGKRRKSLAGEVSDETLKAHRGATTLDRVHAAMLLQKGGRTNALRALLLAEQERGPDFLRLANAFSALYPRDSEEKRLLDAMLQTMPR